MGSSVTADAIPCKLDHQSAVDRIQYPGTAGGRDGKTGLCQPLLEVFAGIRAEALAEALVTSLISIEGGKNWAVERVGRRPLGGPVVVERCVQTHRLDLALHLQGSGEGIYKWSGHQVEEGRSRHEATSGQRQFGNFGQVQLAGL